MPIEEWNSKAELSSTRIGMSIRRPFNRRAILVMEVLKLIWPRLEIIYRIFGLKFHQK